MPELETVPHPVRCGATWRPRWLALITGCGILLLDLFYWEAMRYLAFFFDFLAIAFFILFFVTSILAVRDVLRRPSHRPRARATLFFNLFVALALFTLPIQRLRQDLNFRRNYSRRMDAVRMAEAGELRIAQQMPDEGLSLLELPSGYEDLAWDHRLRFYRRPNGHTLALFSIYAGCMGDCGGGFLYVSESGPLSELPQEFSQNVHSFDAHWLWAEQR